MMKLRLVSGMDGSETSLSAVDWAVDEAALHGLPLRLVQASRWQQHEGAALALILGRPSEQALADSIVETAVERARQRHPDVDLLVEVLPEDAVIALLHEGHNAQALITGARGRGGLTGLLLGSFSLAVAARALCPVIVVRGDRAGIEGVHGRILVGVGEPEKREAAVRFAFQEARARGCDLDAARAWRCPAHYRADPRRTVSEHLYHQERAATLIDEAVAESVRDYPAVRLHSAAVEGTAAKVLAQRSAAADLIVVGAIAAAATSDSNSAESPIPCYATPTARLPLYRWGPCRVRPLAGISELRRVVGTQVWRSLGGRWCPEAGQFAPTCCW